MNLTDLMSWVEPDRQACREEAERLRLKYRGLSDEDLARKAMSRARNQAMAAGAVTGVASTPLTMIPAALADAAAVLRIEGFMAGVIAAILDPDSLDSPTDFLADVVAVVFPAAATQALRQVTIQAGTLTTKALIRKYVSEDLIKSTLRFALRFLGMEATQKAVISKTVPVVGAGIGAAWNWIEIRAVGARALKYHHPKSNELGKTTVTTLNRKALPPA